MTCAGAHALCSLSISKPNKELMRKCGLVPLMSRLLKSVHIDLIIPIMGTCQNCSSEVNKLFIITYHLCVIYVHYTFCMPQMGKNFQKIQKENFQVAAATEKMVSDIVYHLYSENMEIKLQSSLAIFKCASNKVSVYQTYLSEFPKI